MTNPFLRQREAWDFVRSIEDSKERLLTELAVGRALSFLATDTQYREEFSSCPFDVLTFARATNAFLKKGQVLEDVLSGKVTSVDDLSPF